MQPDTFRPLGMATVDFGGILNADGLSAETKWWLGLLVDEYQSHAGHNEDLRRYYDGRVQVSDYGSKAEVPNDQTCHWPSKAVDALADRIRLERINAPADYDRATLDGILGRNNLVNGYNRHLTPKLLYGCMAATVTRNAAGHAVVRFHSAETFTAVPSPDGRDGVVGAGLAIARMEFTPWGGRRMVPTIVNLHLPGNVVELRQVAAGQWVAEDGLTPEREPSLYVFCHDGTGTMNAFGRTRVTRFVRTLTDDAIRCMWHMQISGAYYSVPKLAMLNLLPEQYEAVVGDKLKYQLDRVLATEVDESGGPGTTIQQFSGNSPQPFVDELRALAAQFSGATGVPLNSLGIVQDNPSSAEAIGASREDICLIAQRDIDEDRKTIERVVRAALSVERNTTIDQLGDGDRAIAASFADPLIHSRSEMADWAVKINSMRPSFGQTDVAARMVGIDDADLESVKSDEVRAASAAAFNAIFSAGE
jgi:DNA gyrase inhibitor GyrI